MLVLGGGVFTVGGLIGRFFPILETIPSVGKSTSVGECPLDVETIREV